MDTSRLKVDKATRTATGIRFMSPKSKNGAEYPTLAKQFRKYDKARVFLNHDLDAVKAGRQRDIRLWAATTSEPDKDGYCHLVFNRNKAGDFLMDLCEKNPDMFGMSPTHMVKSEMGPRGKIITDIVSVASVDAVLNPATTSSIVEEIMDEPAAETPMPSSEDLWGALVAAYMREGDEEAAAKVLKFKTKMSAAASESSEAGEGEGEGEGREEVAATEEVQAPPPVLARIEARLAALEKAPKAPRVPRGQFRVEAQQEAAVVTEEVAVPGFDKPMTLEERRALWSN